MTLDEKYEIKKNLEERGIQAKDLAKELGITESYLSKILSGKRNGKEWEAKIKTFLEIK